MRIKKKKKNKIKNWNKKYERDIRISFETPSIYLSCKYKKYYRGLSQTPMNYSEKSLSGEIFNGFKEFKECQNAFKLSLHAGGREDKDVRMLGNGRPTCIEIKCPTFQTNAFTPQLLQQIENKVSKKQKIKKEKTNFFCFFYFWNKTDVCGEFVRKYRFFVFVFAILGN